MKLYIAGPFISKVVLSAFANKLKNDGFIVVSNWLYESEAFDDNVSSKQMSLRAQSDIREIEVCDAFVLYVPPLKDTLEKLAMSCVKNISGISVFRQTGITGGYHVELGYALAFKKLIFAVGQPLNVFHHLGNVVWSPTLRACAELLRVQLPVNKAK
jgi:hypothetical protein